MQCIYGEVCFDLIYSFCSRYPLWPSELVSGTEFATDLDPATRAVAQASVLQYVGQGIGLRPVLGHPAAVRAGVAYVLSACLPA